MRTFLLATLITIVLNPMRANAFHYLGGEISYVNVKGPNKQPTDNYKWRVVTYTDKNIQGAAPSTFGLNICKNSNASVEVSIPLTKINPSTYLNFPDSVCPLKSAQNMIEYAVYESAPINHSNLTDPLGYYAVYNLCCVQIYNNISSTTYSAMNFMDFKPMGTNSIARYNTSPQFTKPVMQVLKVGVFYTLDWSATDPDGDSLVYVIDTPKLGNGLKSNWDYWQFNAGYSANSNVADGNPDFRINSQTGKVTYKPLFNGRYLISVRVDEYRKINGVATKIAESSREMTVIPTIPQDIYPVLYDSLRNTTVLDTLLVTNPIIKTLSFSALDIENDSIFIKIIPDKSATSNNILDTSLIKATWMGMTGIGYMGVDAENYVIKRIGTSFAYLTIEADSNHISNVPYKFKIVCFKKNCPYPLTDTVHYELIISGEKCYNSTVYNFTACDSIVLQNGNTYYQSVQFADTLTAVVGCNQVNITNINIEQTPIANFNNLNIYVTDTSQIYSYMVDTQSNARYQWNVSAKGSIVSGANTNTVNVKWNTDTTMQSISCFINRGNCFDSISSPIVVSHIVGLNSISPNKIKVYPNPVNDVLTFDTNYKLENANIKIYNTFGQLQLESTLSNNELNVTKLPKGVFLVVIDGAQRFQGTFIKE